MANLRLSSNHRNSSSSTFKFIPKKLSPLSLTLYTILLFCLSITLFILYSKDVLDDDQTPLFSKDFRSGFHHIRQFQQVADAHLWVSTFSRNLRPCVKPTSNYKAAYQDSNRFITVKCNGGLNQMRTGVIHVAKSDSRLANNDLPLDIQRLRCRTLYRALRFSPSIELLGKRLVERLRSRGGKYIALHLRYEKDMLSFTGCTYGLSNAESEELRIMRENTNHWKIKKINATEQRNAGYCPLTPKEVGIFIQALGYPSSTLIYIAAGEIYGGARRLSDLTVRFPNVVIKETLATQDELEAFSGHASQTAAIDYIISVESNVFIPSHSGNMARAVEGHRRFLGHRKTITPDRKGLIEVFDKLESGQLEKASSLSEIVKEMHRTRQGAPRKRGGPPSGIKGRARLRYEESFYQNPFPECICNSLENRDKP
ncbi:O-fucosyltransferase 38-like isoform X2 [Silene latifolia]|uniref:O-fucosyltransferase 38-like isoform X2 n=1 Tax=Silene latifolia TaxID=37657 RepID=UPI003D7835A3